MYSQWFFQDTFIEVFKKGRWKLSVRASIHPFGQLSKRSPVHPLLFLYLWVMKTTLKHHKQIGKTVHCIRVNKHSVGLISLKIRNSEGFNNPLNNLRLSRQREMPQQNPKSFINRKVREVDLPNKMLSDWLSNLIMIPYKHANIGGVKSF